MRTPFAAASRAVASLAAVSLAVVGLLVAGPVATAAADSAPVDPGTPTTVTADALPTVQIDGVAWSQIVVDGTVYVAGQFTTARPAGAAPGTNTVTRSNLLAYDLDTGVLIDSWAPVLDGPAFVIRASLDGTRLYVGGDFTRVNGAVQNRFVVLDRATGLRVAGFTAGANAAVRAIVSTPSTIYFGGNFNTVAGLDRPRLAAINASTGAVLNWRVSAQSAEVQALTLSPDNSRLIVGGRFTMLNGIPALGSGAVSTTTGAVQPWAANQLVTDYGFDSGITSLETDGTLVYGTGFGFLNHAGGYGNLEGTFAADPMTGVVKWVEDCHGDTYSVYANPGNDEIYIAGHPYYCGNIGMFPEASPRFHHYALSFSKADAMTITPGIHSNYYDWQGNRAPDQLNFYPDFIKGAFTGQDQAVWNVTGSGDYVLYGGEFVSINGVAQQGLTRFTTSSTAPNKQGPRLTGTATTPVATSKSAGTAQVSWPSNWDRDNETLTYDVYRNNGATPVYSTSAKSRFFQLPRLSFTDTGLVNGQVYSYKVLVRDAFGNSVTSPSVNVTVAGASAGAIGAYAREVLADNPAGYWRLGENSGTGQDWTGYADATVGGAVTRAVTGALAGDTNKAARFNGTSTSKVYETKQLVGSNRFSVEAWFRTTSTTGGKIVGFGSSNTTSASGSYDRHVYMGADGRLTFGVFPNSTRAVTSPAAYNDGQWHQVVGALGANGMQLYVDGVLRAEDTNTVSAQQFSGYWRIGGDPVGGWPNAGADNFTGDIDDVAVYGRALTANDVTVHYGTGSTGIVPNLAPTASFVGTGATLSATFNASASSDSDGTIASYAWDFGDGATGTGVTTSHDYTVEGTYPVVLTVTDDDGATATVAHDVVVLPVNVLPVASFVATPAGLSVTTDASASNDPDGSITSYAWNFGDGATATGATGSHAYVVAGTYPVTLTVTDNRGGTATVAQDVAVAPYAIGYLAYDRFDQPVANGFGSADLGGAWTTSATGTSVSSGSGAITMAGANGTAGARLTAISGTELTTQVTESWDKRPNGSGGWLTLRGRITPGGEYRLKVLQKATGAVTAKIVRTNSAGTESSVNSETTVPGLTYSAGTAINAKFEVIGTGPTALRAKVWLASTAEPAAWFFDVTDATAALQVAGHTGLSGLLSSSTTNGPATLRVDEYIVRGPNGSPTLPPPNVAPTPSFTAVGDELAASVDGTASSDADGTVTGYAWDFGDGGTATGATAAHAYLNAGTYPVKLTVTDDDGATASVTHDVVVLPLNQMPTASFTSSSAGLTASVDASTSSDPDGTIASYVWDFGDGATATGPTASHTYAAPGTRLVGLTVTDNRGGSSSVQRQLDVGYMAVDRFERTVADGFGTADLGGAWSATAGVTSVTNGGGVLALAGANSSASARLPAAIGTNLTTQVTESWDLRPTGLGGSVLVRGRITPNGEYRLKVGHKSNGSVTARLVRTNAAGSETVITSEVTVPSLTYTTGTAIKALFDVSGTSPTTLRAKVWAASSAEPAAWFFDTTDATAGLQVAGHPGVAGILSTSVTNGPIKVRVDDLTVIGSGAPPPPNVPPTASFTATGGTLTASVDASASSDPDGTIATYAWDFGDGGTGSGATATHPYLTGGTYPVTLTVTDNGGATASTSQPVVVAAANQLPVASFTASPTGLTAALDASASADPDGSIVSYVWDFGDTTSGTGVTTSHAYSTSGTRSVTLTVTDNVGATATVSHDVTVAGVNQPPVASFTATPTGLSVAFDASATADPDGAIASYAWSFGDTTSDSGVTTTHVYGAPGAYDVILTVTDDQGATAVSQQQVTVAQPLVPPPGAVAWDTFERTVPDGFGAATLGGAWSTTAGLASVTGGVGQMSLTGANSLAGARLPGVEGSTFTTRVGLTVDKRPNGNGGTVLVRGRITTAGEYRLKLGLKSNGTVTAAVVRTNSAGTETSITAAVTVPGLTYNAGTKINTRLEVSGTSPTVLRAAVWGATAEPSASLIDVTDTTAALQTTGHTGFAVQLSSTTTNGPLLARFDDFTVTAP